MSVSEGPGYGSAEDLPRSKTMREQLAALEMLTPLVADGRDSRVLEIEQLSRRIDWIAQTVDSFYGVLGPLNWVFHDRLPLDEVASLLEESPSPEEAQNRFVTLCSDQAQLERWVEGSWLRPGLCPRRHLLRRALDQFERKEFDSSTLTLITVMDGYVQDIDGQFGLHAKHADEMVAWDSVAGHHMGLTHALRPFRKQIKRRRDDEVFELYRNGIAHGQIVNYNNQIVASKAWNMLLALVDWADSQEKATAKKEEKSADSLADLPVRLATSDARIKRINEWERRVFLPDDPSFQPHEAAALTREFLEAWKSQNYGHIAQLAHRVWYRGRSDKWVAGEVRRNFSGFEIEEYDLQEIDGSTNDVWEVRGTALVNGERAMFAYRWAVQLPDGWTGGPGDEGPRRLVNCEPVYPKQE